MIAGMVIRNHKQRAASARLFAGTRLNLPYVPGLKAAAYLSIF
jgi:hypothetical protein